jgi:hypothetical protein
VARMRSGERGGNGLPDDVSAASLERLMQRQHKECPGILCELESQKRKVGHWAWWVFPTDRPGASEPPPATSLTPKTARQLLDRAISHCPGWISCLKAVCALVELHGLPAVLPSADLPRVAEFVDLWGKLVGDNPERPDSWHPVIVCARGLRRHFPNNARGAGAAERPKGAGPPPSGGDGAAEGPEGELPPPSGGDGAAEGPEGELPPTAATARAGSTGARTRTGAGNTRPP